jgi:hypothetical protein
MSDILAASANKPIRAFPGQDHQSHIAMKQAFISNPAYAQSEFMVPVLQALTANIREHMLLDFQEKLNATAGVPPTGAATDPNTLAQVQAMAAQQLKQMQETQMQMEQNAQDPAFMMAQAQMLKAESEDKKTQSKEVIAFAQLALKKDEINLEREKLAKQEKMSDNSIMADLVKHDSKLNFDNLHKEKDRKENRTNKALDLLGKAAIEDGKQSSKNSE